MNTKSILTGLLVLSIPLMNGCKGGAPAQDSGESKAAVAQAAAQDKQMEENKKKIEQINHDFTRIPTEGTILEKGENPCYQELKQRYKDELGQLKQSVEATGAKFLMTMISAEAGSKNNASVRYGEPYIKATIGQLGVDCIDFAPIIVSQDIKEITQVPKDGHWSAKGAKLIAGHLVAMIKKYPDAASKTTYKDNERPETFGDLPPNDDEVLDGGKNLPYHVKANSQGVRMDHDLTFPKKKKRVLLMGDSGLFCPFLDNEATIAYAMQEMLPDYEIYTVAAIGWTIEDYISLWNEKTKYTEPDLVIVGTNAVDIEDLFFTHRNHSSRSGKPFYPSPTEEKFYHELYK